MSIQTRFETSENFPSYMKAINKFSILTKVDEIVLGNRIRAGKINENEFSPDAQDAINMLVCANLKWVVKQANTFIGQGVPIADLIMEGNEGLIKAAKKFDPDQNKKFITFAHFYLQKAFNLANGTHGKIVRIPQNQEYDIYKRRMAGEEINTHTIQLDKPIGEKGDNTLGDIILRTNPSDQHDRDHDLLHVNILMKRLNETQKVIITKKYGLDGGDELSIKEIAVELNLPHELISKELRHAMKALKP